MEKVSVIVPVYKVEKYLEKCINSILSQTYRNLEIILVDDGSPDNCGNICDKYASVDQRIKVIHKENGGISDARNVALEQSTGKYILFVDSDDWLDDNHIQEMMCRISEDTIVCCGYKFVYDNSVSIQNAKEIRSYNSVDFIRLLSCYEVESNCFHCDNPYGNYMWNKLYPKVFFQKIRFPKGRNYEDIFVSYKLLRQAKNVWVNGYASYNYLQRQDSTMAVKSKKSQFDWLEARLSQESDTITLGIDILRDSKLLSLISAIGTYISHCKGDYDLNHDEICSLRKIVSERMRYLNSKEVFSKLGLKVVLFMYFPYLLKFIFKIKNR